METATTYSKTTADFNVDKEAQRLWKILCKQHNKNRPMPAIKVVRRKRKESSGSYDYELQFLNLQMGTETVDAWETLAHELIHAIGFNLHNRSFYQALKQLTEKRWKTRINAFGWDRYGYECDWSIQQQLRDSNCINI